MRYLIPLVAATLTSTASAQVAFLGPATEEALPCTNLSNEPKVGQCWECFQHLLSDCDRVNPDGPRRAACYDGANNTLQWCLGRVSSVSHDDLPVLIEMYAEGRIDRDTFLELLDRYQ